MNGPGAMPPQPNDGTRIGLRVLFVLLAVASCGMLAWAPLLRVAVLRRRNAADWVLCGASFVLTITLFVLIGMDGSSDSDSNSPRSNAAVAVLLIQAVAVAVYYLVTDIRHFRAVDAQAASRPYGQQQFPYGVQPQQQQPPAQRAGYNPYRDTPTPNSTPAPVPGPPVGAPEPTPAPGPAGPPAPRIEQVRAELDELSDYLRKEEGR